MVTCGIPLLLHMYSLDYYFDFQGFRLSKTLVMSF